MTNQNLRNISMYFWFQWELVRHLSKIWIISYPAYLCSHFSQYKAGNEIETGTNR